MQRSLLMAVVTLAAWASTLSFAEDAAQKDAKPVGDPYPLATDAATGEPLGETPIVMDHEGREFRFANEANAEAFRGDAAGFIAKVDEAIIADQRPFYPLTTCVSSGEELGAMGDAEEVVLRNRLVRLCCAGCSGDLEKDPAKILAKLDAAAIEKQRADYPIQTCAVSSLPIDEMSEAMDVVVAGRLIRLCCPGCTDELKADPAGVIAKIDAARAKR